MGVLDVLKHTQQLFNSRKRQGRETHIVGIKCQVGGLNRNEAFDMGLQPDHTTPTELRMMSEGVVYLSAADNSIGPKTREFISFYGIWYDTPLTSRYSARRHHPWPVYGLPMYRLAPQSSWI